ncbi:hypothetical protein Q0F98_30705 [Paenibacillus amylolyticus]|nr:hypothetical protein Q0F98_30705 [Paenibacillus amylolyticus]
MKSETLPFADYTRWLFDASISKEPEALQLAIAQLEGDSAKDSAYVYACPVTTAYVEPAGISCARTDDASSPPCWTTLFRLGTSPPQFGTIRALLQQWSKFTLSSAFINK